jgi:hypothetical protein
MNAFDAGDSLWAKSFEPLMDGALDLLFWGLEVIKSSAVAVAECFPAISAANHIDGLVAPDRIATVVS